jgi:hypothetical protein
VEETVAVDSTGDGTIDTIEVIETTGVDTDGDGDFDEIEVTDVTADADGTTMTDVVYEAESGSETEDDG